MTSGRKNALCPPIAYWDTSDDYLTAFLAMMAFTTATASHARLASWIKATRLNPTSGIAAHREDPRVITSRERFKRFGLQAAMNIQRLVSKPSAS